MTTLLAMLMATAIAANPAPELEGDFCEVIWGKEAPQRVSCFHTWAGTEGLQLEGTAYSWARENKDGKLVAPLLSTWKLDQVVSYSAATKTLVYTYSGTMSRTEAAFAGQSTARFDFDSEPAPEGSYGDKTEAPARFRLVRLEALETCLGVTQPSDKRAERYKRVATSTEAQLKGCVPALE